MEPFDLGLQILMLLMTNLDSPRENHLLDALPADEYERLFPYLEPVPMPLGEIRPLRIGGQVTLRLFSHDLHRVQTLRHGESG